LFSGDLHQDYLFVISGLMHRFPLGIYRNINKRNLWQTRENPVGKNDSETQEFKGNFERQNPLFFILITVTCFVMRAAWVDLPDWNKQNILTNSDAELNYRT